VNAVRHVVVMVTSSYPRFPGDGVGSFIEPIAKGVAALGHDVHVVAPWHPAVMRGTAEDGVCFHFYKYALTRSMNVFGYAQGLKADTDLRAATWVAAPAALAAGWLKAWRVASKRGATVMHAHWVVPGGLQAALAAGRLPLVVSLHGSDVYVAERHPLIGVGARAVFRRAGWVTACSADLAARAVALGARREQTEMLPYGVDTSRFAPSRETRRAVRQRLGIGEAPLVFSAGRLVRKKGFEYLLAAARPLRDAHPDLRVVIAGEGDLRAELDARASSTPGLVTLLGNQSQDEIARLAAAADVIAVPSVHDEAGNVDGLPNFALEALASGTPVVATRVGGLPDAISDRVTGRLVPERDAGALAAAMAELLDDSEGSRRLGAAARDHVARTFGWARVAERLVVAYDRAGRRQPLVGANREC
jgi:glycosyltransferase involved in cell wall biosynthesis